MSRRNFTNLLNELETSSVEIQLKSNQKLDQKLEMTVERFLTYLTWKNNIIECFCGVFYYFMDKV